MHDLGLSAYKNMLFWLSAHTRYDQRWWLVFSVSIIAILAWLSVALPIFMPLPPPDWISRYNWATGDLTIWNIVTIPGEYGNAYWCLVFFAGIPFVKIAWIWAEISHNLALGRRFVCPPPGGILNGDWISD